MEVICLDSDLLIDFRRSTRNKRIINPLIPLIGKYDFAVSVITVYEILRGKDDLENNWWLQFFANTIVLNFTYATAVEAGKIYREMKIDGTLVPTDDILIAATAIEHSYKLATQNKNHFLRISGLQLI